MTTITTFPWTLDVRPETVSGAPAAGGCMTEFLAPPSVELEQPAPRTSDRDEPAMRRLRHPFAVVAR